MLCYLHGIPIGKHKAAGAWRYAMSDVTYQSLRKYFGFEG